MASSHWVTQWIGCNPTNYNTGRGGYGVNGIVIHHACCTNIGSMDNIFQRANYGGSAHYGVQDWTVHQYVDENDCSWHCGNYWGNQNTIGIECVNLSLGGDYPVSDETLEMTAQLVADIAKRYNLGKLYLNPSEDCPKLSGHRDWSATACVPINTEVLTKDGWKAIADVEIGEDIATALLDSLDIKFSPVLWKVPEKEQDTWEINSIEVTADHRMLWKTQRSATFNRVNEFQDLPDNQAVYIPTAGHYAGEGLPLSDNEIKLLIAVQADGHYEHGDHSGKDRVTFHVSKDRKIALLDNILSGYDYKKYQHADGTVSYNVKGIKDFCETYLEDKKFTYKFLEMSPEQARLFLDTLLDFDGCRAGDDYSSSLKQNIDVVDAVASINGVGIRHNGDKRTDFVKHYRTLDKRECPVRRRGSVVSCVTVESGFILIRQHGRTAIVGNCPGDYLYARLQAICDRANEINFPPTPTPEPPHIEWVDVPETTLRIKDGGTDLIDINTGTPIKHIEGDFTFVQQTSDGIYVRTQYSKEKGIDNGVLYSDLLQPEPIPEPTPEPTPTPEPDPQPEPVPEPGDDTPNWFIRFIHALGEFFIHLFTKKED